VTTLAASVLRAFLKTPSFDGVWELLARLLLAFLLGLGIAWLHALQRTRRGGTSLAGTLVLLAPLIALVVWAIGDDIARAFGLVGILAIVRFRTVVRDPADAVYLLFSVAAGVAVAAGTSWIHPVAGCAAIALGIALVGRGGARWGMGAPPRLLVVRLATNALDAVERSVRAAGLASVRSAGLRSFKGGGVVEARYEVTSNDPGAVDRLVLALARTDGVHEASTFRPRG
jgi:hypothetical protein